MPSRAGVIAASFALAILSSAATAVPRAQTPDMLPRLPGLSDAQRLTLGGAGTVASTMPATSDIPGAQTNLQKLYDFRFPAAVRDAHRDGGAARAAYLGVLTPTAVPEPATWALMILGFGTVGAAVRRRTARKRAPAR